MRLRPHFTDTYGGIITVALALAGLLGGISVVMYLFRPFCEPILQLVLPIIFRAIAQGYRHFSYDPGTYWFLDGCVAILAVAVLLIGAVTIVKKPGQDRRIDDALRKQTAEFSHGAPIDPE